MDRRISSHSRASAKRQPDNNSRSRSPRNRKADSSVDRKKSEMPMDSFKSLETKEHALMSELQRLQEKKQWLMDVLKNVGYDDLERLKISAALGKSSVQNRARLPQGESTEGSVESRYTKNSRQKNKENDEEPDNEKSAQSPKGSVMDNRRERSRVLADSSRRLNTQIQQQLQEFAADHHSSEFDRNDAHNFINTYKRKIGYLAASKTDVKKTATRNMQPNATQKLAAESLPESAISQKEGIVNNYENDFESATSATDSPVAIAISAPAKRKDVKSVEQPASHSNETHQLVSSDLSGLAREVTLLIIPTNHVRSVSPDRVPVSPSDIRLIPKSPNRRTLGDKIQSPKLIRVEILQDPDSWQDRNLLEPSQIALPDLLHSATTSTAHATIPALSFSNVTPKAEHVVRVLPGAGEPESSDSEGPVYSPTFTPRSESPKENKNLPAQDRAKSNEPNQPGYLFLKELSIAPAVNGSVEQVHVDSLDSSVPIDISDSDTEQDLSSGSSQSLSKRSMPLGLEKLNSHDDVEVHKRSVSSSSTLSSVSDAFIDSDADGKAETVADALSSSQLVPADDHSKSKSPFVGRNSRVEEVSSSELSSVKSDFLKSDSESQERSLVMPTAVDSHSSLRDAGILDGHHSHQELDQIRTGMTGLLMETRNSSPRDSVTTGSDNDIQSVIEELPDSEARLGSFSDVMEKMDDVTPEEDIVQVVPTDNQLQIVQPAADLETLHNVLDLPESTSPVLPSLSFAESVPEKLSDDVQENVSVNGQHVESAKTAAPDLENYGDDFSTIDTVSSLTPLSGDSPASVAPLADGSPISTVKPVADEATEHVIPFETDIHYPDEKMLATVLSARSAKHAHHGESLLSARSLSSVSLVSDDLASVSDADSIFKKQTDDLIPPSPELGSADIPNTPHLAAPSVVSPTKMDFLLDLPKPLSSSSVAVEDWLDDDFFSGILPPAAPADSHESVTVFRSSSAETRSSTTVQQDKLDKLLPLVKDISRFIFDAVWTENFTNYFELTFESISDSLGVQSEEARMVFDGIIDFCDQTFQLPRISVSATKPFDTRQRFPKNMEAFVQLMLKGFSRNTAQMILPVTGPTLTIGGGDQEELEQQAVYKLAMQDLERFEDDWCNFQEGEKILQEESANAIWDDLMNDLTSELKQDSALGKLLHQSGNGQVN